MPLGRSKKPKRHALSVKVAKKEAPLMTDGIVDEDELIAQSLQKLNRLGLKVPSRPTDANGVAIEPHFPSDLTKLTNEQLGRLSSQLTAMVDYAMTQLAILESRFAVTADNEKVQRTISSLQGDGRTVKSREQGAVVSQSTRDRALRNLQRNAEYRILKAIVEGYLNKSKTASREVSRRELSLQLMLHKGATS